MGGVLGIGVSVSKTKSTQDAESYLTQQFSSSCNITCQNSMTNVNVDIINSDVAGGIDITQSCAANGQCISSSTQDAISDVLFKAVNSSNASNAAAGIISANFDWSSASSKQSIKQSISQSVNEKCNVATSNNMSGINIFASNSNISGGIAIAQQGSTTGACTLSNTMSAAASATGMADNSAASGKKAGKSSKGQIISTLIIAVVIIVGAIIFARIYTGGRSSDQRSEYIDAVIEAKALTKCGSPDRIARFAQTKKVLIDSTGDPLCQPPPPRIPSKSPSRDDPRGELLAANIERLR